MKTASSSKSNKKVLEKKGGFQLVEEVWDLPRVYEEFARKANDVRVILAQLKAREIGRAVQFYTGYGIVDPDALPKLQSDGERLLVQNLIQLADIKIVVFGLRKELASEKIGELTETHEQTQTTASGSDTEKQ